MASLADLQKLQGMVDRRRSAGDDPLLHLALLTQELGDVGEEVALWRSRVLELQRAGAHEESARSQAYGERREKLGLELADCLALLLRLAAGAGVNLEECYQLKLDKALKG